MILSVKATGVSSGALAAHPIFGCVFGHPSSAVRCLPALEQSSPSPANESLPAPRPARQASPEVIERLTRLQVAGTPAPSSFFPLMLPSFAEGRLKFSGRVTLGRQSTPSTLTCRRPTPPRAVACPSHQNKDKRLAEKQLAVKTSVKPYRPVQALRQEIVDVFPAAHPPTPSISPHVLCASPSSSADTSIPCIVATSSCWNCPAPKATSSGSSSTTTLQRRPQERQVVHRPGYPLGGHPPPSAIVDRAVLAVDQPTGRSARPWSSCISRGQAPPAS